MYRSIMKITAAGAAVVLVVAGSLVAWAKWQTGRSYASVRTPPIVADLSPRSLARGEQLFQSLCMECHGGPDGRATGKRLDDVPAFLGTFYSANLAHADKGIAKRSDGELARVLRFGVLPDGRYSPAMSSFSKLGDTDVAALLGYMRSGAEVFSPGGPEQPHTRLTAVGAAIITFVAGIDMSKPPSGVPVPAKSVSVEYGRYMAQAMDCVTCHTEGFSSDKMNHAQAFAGGFELTDPTGAKIWTKNITFDEDTGIGGWSRQDFDRALRRGVTPAGYLVRKPMPLFARLDEVDVEAIYTFLQTVPKVKRENRQGGHALQKPRPDDAPEALFVNVGCASCHGDAAPHRDKIMGAGAKTEAQITAWILDPQSIKPGSMMPSFEHAIDPEQARTLARYVKELAKRRGG